MPLWLAERPLVLASKSAIRGAILRAAGLSVEVCPADIDERAIEQGSAAHNPGAVPRCSRAKRRVPLPFSCPAGS
jgi:septum formation protein